MIYDFVDKNSAGLFLAEHLSLDLLKQKDNFLTNFILFPGGKSIYHFYPYLESIILGREEMTISLTDEREVPYCHALSNLRQTKEWLGLFKSENVNLLPLTEEVIELSNKVKPIVVLSMGEDGHIASLFPNDEKLWLSKTKDELVFTATVKPSRKSISLSLLDQSLAVYVLVIGNERISILETILSNKKHPFYHLFRKATILRGFYD